MSRRLWIYGFPGGVGGADTKMVHTLPIFKLLFDEVMCIANAPEQYDPPNQWTQYLDSLGIKYGLKEEMKGYQPGDFALSLCNPWFFKQKFVDDAVSKELKVIWSSEMMWHHEGELDAIKEGKVYKVLYVSELQQAVLQYPPNIPYTMTGNFVNPEVFPFRRRSSPRLGIGRLSRADSYKYPEDFPVFYEEIVEGLDPNRIQFRVMGWNDELIRKYSWHNWKRKYSWVLLEEQAMPTLDFLYGIDIFAYPLGHNFVESWGRSTVEAMLTGAIPVVFSGHHLQELIEDKVTGFIVDDIYEWKQVMQILFHNVQYRFDMSKRCSELTAERHCNLEDHVRMWEEVFI